MTLFLVLALAVVALLQNLTLRGLEARVESLEFFVLNSEPTDETDF